MSARTLVAVVGAGLVGGGLVAAAACGPGDLGDLTGGRRDATVSPEAAPGPDAAPDVAPCSHAAAPGPPATTVDGPSGADLLFAMEDLRFDVTDVTDGGAPAPSGLDLDRTCNCAEPTSCARGATGKPACDLPDGRDNAGGPLLARLGALTPGLGGPTAVRGQIRQGRYDFLVSVQGWNGQPDDPHVIVGLRASGGIEGIQDAGFPPPPRFDGTDVWTADPSTILSGETLTDCRTQLCVPSFIDRDAYVSGGVVVAHGDLPLVFETGAGRFAVTFLGGTLVLRVRTEGSVARATGELTGRWATREVLSSFGAVRDPSTGQSLCGDNPFYKLVKGAICDTADLAATPSADRTGAPCGAISVAVAFTGVEAKLGAVYAPVGKPSTCPGFTDRCD